MAIDKEMHTCRNSNNDFGKDDIFTGNATAEEKIDGTTPVKIGMYVDAGSRGNGVVSWARILTYSPQAELYLMDGDDLREGMLDGLDVLLMPGGCGFRQHNSMGLEGAEAVRKFIFEGGGYIGTCAGMAISFNEPDRIQLIKYRRIIGDLRGGGTLAIEVSEEGAAMLGVNPGRHMVKYSNGPLPQLTDQPGSGDSKVIAVYDSTLGAPGSEGCSMYGIPAMIHGIYGEGKLLVTSFHPEYLPSTLDLALGCLFCLTGCTFTPQFPKKNYSPIRVSYYATGLWNKEGTENALGIDASPITDLTLTSEQELNEGILDHSDILVLPDGDPDYYRGNLTDKHLEMIERFARRGGFIISSGCGRSFASPGPRHFDCLTNKRIIDVILEQIKPLLSDY